VLDLIEAGMPLTEIVVQLGLYRAARDLGDIEAVASGNPSRVGKRMARKALYSASDLEVAKWAGHRSVSFTKDRYAHLFPEHGMALADRLDAFIRTATPTLAAPVASLRPEASGG
jgi:hypothetical protein